MAHVVMRVGENLIESVITKRSADEMKLKVGDKVSAVIKSKEESRQCIVTLEPWFPYCWPPGMAYFLHWHQMRVRKRQRALQNFESAATFPPLWF